MPMLDTPELVAAELRDFCLVHAGPLVDLVRAQDAQGRPWLLRQLKSRPLCGPDGRALVQRFGQGFVLQQRAQGKGVAPVNSLFELDGSPCIAMNAASSLPLRSR